MSNYVPYQDLREIVRDGDLLLWRPTSLAGRLICWGTGLALGKSVPYSHASMAGWAPNGHLYNLEMIETHGGRHAPLSAQIAKWPKQCDVWRPIASEWSGSGAVDQMLWLMSQRYGWRDFFRIAIKNLFPKIALPPRPNTDDPDEPRVCSAAYHWAARTGGRVAPCDKPDADVSPADLALSGFAEYLATPIP